MNGGQDTNELRNSTPTWQALSGWGVSFVENVSHAKVYYCIFLQNRGTIVSGKKPNFEFINWVLVY
jgi:hypothetical protein